MLGGGWFYFGGAPTGQPNQFGQPQVKPTSPLANVSNYLAGTFATSAPATPPPVMPLGGGPTIRIASFNIQVFGDEKAKKPYVMQTLALAVRNFHVVAIQEIRTQDSYLLDNFLRTYVNQNGRQYNKVIGPRLGRTNSKEQYCIL